MLVPFSGESQQKLQCTQVHQLCNLHAHKLSAIHVKQPKNWTDTEFSSNIFSLKANFHISHHNRSTCVPQKIYVNSIKIKKNLFQCILFPLLKPPPLKTILHLNFWSGLWVTWTLLSNLYQIPINPTSS